MKTFDRYNKDGKAGTRVIEVSQCWECPYAETTRKIAFGCYVTCRLTNNDYCFDDNMCHFSTPSDCPLELLNNEENDTD